MRVLERFSEVCRSGWMAEVAAPPIVQGMLEDYRRLARFHYRASPPASCVRVLAIREDDEPIAVLTVSMPTLNAPWRAGVWPELHAAADQRLRAAQINTHVRTISRIVVDPRWRGRGLARRLVRAYLDHPLTRCTEAVAVMGACCPFFTRAGMMPRVVPPPAHDQRLGRVLANAGILPWQLVDAAVQDRMARDSALARKLRTWARASRATRAMAEGPIAPLALRAAAALSAERIAWFYTAPGVHMHRDTPPIPEAPAPAGACAPACRGSHDDRPQRVPEQHQRCQPEPRGCAISSAF